MITRWPFYVTPPRPRSRSPAAVLAFLIALMNTVNRLNVITQQPAGDYVPGQFA